MGFHEIAAAVMLGNALLLCMAWAMSQFHRHQHNASWLAYAAFLMPLAYLMTSLILTEGLPQSFGALALR